MAPVNIRERLIAAGVRNLHEFGYPQCNAENILTDEIFGAFFDSMLESNKGNGAAVDLEISKLLNRHATEGRKATPSAKLKRRKDAE